MATALLMPVAGSSPVMATGLVVSTLVDVAADDGACSLRGAIIAADADAPSGALPGECPGGGAAGHTVRGGSGEAGGGGVHNAGTLTITRSTITGNSADCLPWGVPCVGAGYNVGTLGITRSTFSGNDGAYAGGIHNAGSLTIAESVVSANVLGIARSGSDAATGVVAYRLQRGVDGGRLGHREPILRDRLEHHLFHAGLAKLPRAGGTG